MIRSLWASNPHPPILVTSSLGPQEPLLATVKRRKFARFRRVTRHDSLPKTILQGTLEGGRRRGRQKKCWIDNIKEWTSLPMPELPTRASCRKDWKRISAESSLMTIQSVKGLDWTELNCAWAERVGCSLVHWFTGHRGWWNFRKLLWGLGTHS